MPLWRNSFRPRQQTLRQWLTDAQASQTQWRLLKLFPQCFGVVPSEEALTERQWIWLQCQLLLDEGAVACPQCEALGVGPYCHNCGTRLAPEARLCDQCHVPGTGAYCATCGAVLRSPTEDAIDAGTFDWAAWTKSLTPFLGGLTTQEQRLLAQEGIPYGP